MSDTKTELEQIEEEYAAQVAKAKELLRRIGTLKSREARRALADAALALRDAALQDGVGMDDLYPAEHAVMCASDVVRQAGFHYL